MGGTSKSTTTQSSSLSPYDPASGALTGLLGGLTNLSGSAGSTTAAQNGALNTIEANANNNPFASPMTSGTLGLLNGGGATNNDAAIKSNLGMLQNGIVGQTASGANIGNNPALKAQLDQITTDVTNSTNGAWAAAGRDGSPGNAQALGRGIASGVAPVIAAQYNTDVTNALNAANTLYGAGNTTYGILNANNATANQNFANGVGTAGTALDSQNWGANATLAAEGQRFGIPASQLTTLLGAVAPVAAQFGTQRGTSNTESQMSGAQQFATIASGIGSLWPKGNISFGG
ncbi:MULTISPECIES: tail fiber domain-containing protein [unclassified Bradyrhizobium]|uniref:tail fiber domain-containing protein n=1 Tax=unclassified Bradyrhizobium TaxID=2631580 RepID=UPI001BA92D34|nr:MULTISPECIES: tail fiber domain-containing protein [unclassified Bradyrhizobium]MBR1206617.1 tail fiber domain-containing protein [Bradyrhizobium sp. AUGA SZCCT0124]MBR1315405.1 tail fiber domain-containing protein [Bradyrhizobium sp. AUGA SZCCT0051]MBR1338533.1 tail fiber domain-containing protein [Bradyrhizobium sp. AUGA SZCCT0105]MBR1356188.1 tail fiber domain-containing protein [Bradyrhizobium sp. AUGA SZCCT0045]